MGTYSATMVSLGGSAMSAMVTPSAAPSDNGTIDTLTASAPGFTGTLTGNPLTGVVSVGNAGPRGGPYTVTVTATDNCGAQTPRTFGLTVIPAIAATSLLQVESCSPTNLALDPGERVTCALTLNNGSAPTANLVATLQPGTNVLAPSAAQSFAGWGSHRTTCSRAARATVIRR